jgi:hypothetical protein
MAGVVASTGEGVAVSSGDGPEDDGSGTKGVDEGVDDEVAGLVVIGDDYSIPRANWPSL